MLVTYQTLISEINQIPVVFLQDVYNVIHTYKVRTNHKEQNRNKIMQLAGSWADMSENDFMDLTAEIKRNRNEIFSREIEL